MGAQMVLTALLQKLVGDFLGGEFWEGNLPGIFRAEKLTKTGPGDFARKVGQNNT